MPSDKDPSKLNSSSGQAGQNSVRSRSLQTGGGQGGGGAGISLPIDAEDVVSDPPQGVAGSRVQYNIEQLDHDAPRRPNFLNENNHNSKNPSNVTYPDTVDGRYHQSGNNPDQRALLTNTQKPQVKGIVFPADRGILAVKSLKGTPSITQALNLEKIFQESLRESGQSDYTSSKTVGDVKDSQGNALPQGIELRNRVPMATSYPPSAPFETYPNDWDAYQIADATVKIDVGSAGDQGVFEVVHYKTMQDFKQGLAGSGTPATYASFAEQGGGSDHHYFYDDDTSTSVSIDGSVSFSMNDPSDSKAGTKKWLSGVFYYDGVNDDYTFSFDVDGLFEDSFLTKGVAIRLHPGDDTNKRTYDYTSYDGNGTDPANSPVATYSTGSDLWGAGGVGAADLAVDADPEFWAGDPFGRSDTESITSNNLLINTDSDFDSSPGSPSDPRVQEEVFSSEILRHKSEVSHPSNTSNFMDPTGNVGWDIQTESTNDLTAGSMTNELQVAGVPPSVPNYDKSEGGCLTYPTTNYSSGYNPNNNNANYSGAQGTRHYTRAFDTDEPLREGKFRIIGEHTSGSIWNDFKYQKDTANGGHPEGLRIQIAPANITDQKWKDLGREFGDGDGVMVDVNEVSNQEVVVKYRTQKYTTERLNSTIYPIGWRVTVFDQSNVANNGDFYLYKVKWEKV